MSERKEGWYWAKYSQDDDWQCTYYDLHSDAFLFAEWGAISNQAVSAVGPRIPAPDEPWQCVPNDPTREMLDSTGDKSAEAYHGMLGAWTMMLRRAPKP